MENTNSGLGKSCETSLSEAPIELLIIHFIAHHQQLRRRISNSANLCPSLLTMSSAPTTPRPDPPVQARSTGRKVPRRVPLSCLPCRQHKLRCDRLVPCSTCVRYQRENVCRQHPAPAKPNRRPPSRHPHANALPVETSPTATGASAASKVVSTSTAGQTSRIQSQIVSNVHMDSAAQALGSGRAGLADTQAPVLFPQVLPLLQIDPLDALTLLSCQSQVNQKLLWKKFLVKLLPTRTQCDILLTYFVEHINWLFQTVHIPSFRKEYTHFWDGSVDDVNLIWLSLLFTILSLSGLYIPISAIEFVGIQGDSIRKLAHLWHHGSFQALQAGNFETKPCLTQLQTFSITQLYWYATNNIEILNSYVSPIAPPIRFSLLPGGWPKPLDMHKY